jgi:hypothetical protein
MKYTVQKMDQRFSYSDRFCYIVSLPSRMTNSQGPYHFNLLLQWMIRTWGWSPEVRQYDQILGWVSYWRGTTEYDHIRDTCNPLWSWSNGYDDLRIYLATEKELMFLQLNYPIDQVD